MPVRTNAETREFKIGHLMVRVRRNDVHGSTWAIFRRKPEGGFFDKADYTGALTADLPTEFRMLSEFLKECFDRAPASNMPFETTDSNDHPALKAALDDFNRRMRA